MCLERLGKLEIPNGIAGAAGPAGANGAGWASGLGPPSGPPTAEVLFYLNTASGELLKWNSSTLAWQTIVPSIFGTPGAQWLSGSGAPTNPSIDGYFYLDTSNGDIYQYGGGSWGLPLLNIEGTPGTNGVNGTGLLDSFGSNSVTYNPNASYQSLNSLFTPVNASFNAFDAFPTVGSVVRSTMFVKARFLTSATSLFDPNAGPEMFIKPRILGSPIPYGPYDLDTNAVDQNSADSFRKLWPPNSIVSQPVLGQDADTNSIGYARVDIPRRGAANNYPYVYIKITTTLRRSGANTLTSMVEYTTTSRYGTYTAVYDPAVSINISFASTQAIAIEYIGDILVPSTYTATCQVTAISHFVEKIIL